MPAFIELAHDLGVRFVNFIHLIDGDDVVDASENLINHPELLAPNIADAMEAAVRHGIALYVSPALMAQSEPRGTSIPKAMLATNLRQNRTLRQPTCWSRCSAQGHSQNGAGLLQRARPSVEPA